MKVQFELGQPSHERHFTSILDELKSRGHQVIKTSCTRDLPGLKSHKIQAGDHRELMAFEAFIRDDEWGEIAYFIRCARDYIRYLYPEHANSLIIKSRIRNMLLLGYEGANAEAGPALLAHLDRIAGQVDALKQADAAFAALEAMAPPHPAMVSHLANMGADVLCVTPMLMTQYGQTDLIKAAKALNRTVIFLVGSWDNLTTKGTTHLVPDHTLVWNDIQRGEADRFHGISPDSVHVVGAARFDEFWERRIEIPRERFCAQLNLNPARPILTYLGSSNLISSDEKGFVRGWIQAIRESGHPTLKDANLLIRPHPKFSAGWEEAFAGIPGVGVSVSAALNNDPVLYHCLAHARAVVGINTSAELEAAILERPVFTIEDPEFSTGQEGTIHFGYLAGDLAKVGHGLAEHIQQLSAEMGNDDTPGRNGTFLRAFLRPGGLERRAAAVTVDAIERIMDECLVRPTGRAPRISAGGPSLVQALRSMLGR